MVRNCWGNSKERNPKLLPIGDGFGSLLLGLFFDFIYAKSHGILYEEIWIYL